LAHAMLHPRVTAVLALLLSTAAAPGLAAQGLEIAARIGYAAPTGTQFQRVGSWMQSPYTAFQSWDGGGLAVGTTASYWLSTHFGVAGTADLHYTRHQATWGCPPGVACVALPAPVDANATNLVASLRLAARQELVNRLQLGASVGAAVIRWGDYEYQSEPPYYTLTNRTTDGVAAGLSAAYALASRFRLSVYSDVVVFRVRPAPSSGPTTVVAPMQHQFTVGATAAVSVP